MNKSCLYVVATPIGNLQDISLRAIETLKKVNLIICEDTRQTKKLLNFLKISKPLISFHGYSSSQKVETLLKKIKTEKEVALVSDNGTPGISDPGFALTSAAQNEGIKIIPIPGASAFLTALQASGSPINQFLYLGFLPIKKGRKKCLNNFSIENKTIVFYESVHRLKKTLSELSEILGTERNIVIARELTKIYEEFFHGTIKDALEYFKKPKGEFVIIIPGIRKSNKKSLS